MKYYILYLTLGTTFFVNYFNGGTNIIKTFQTKIDDILNLLFGKVLMRIVATTQQDQILIFLVRKWFLVARYSTRI